MTTPTLAEAIRREEGCETRAYPDPLSPLGRACARKGLRLSAWRGLAPSQHGLDGAPWTIGVGHTGPEVGPASAWTQAQIDARLAEDIAKVCAGLDAEIPWWRDLDDPRQDVLAQMGFQLGVPGLLRFRVTLDHARARRFSAAAESMLCSRWARQTPARAGRLSEQMRTGAPA